MSAGQAKPVNPALARHLQERGKRREDRVADQITRFAGSMTFVYIHVIWFTLWIGLGAEDYPFGLLTMIVSLEAIFLSTFVMISQNRADEKRQVIADQQWRTVQEEEQQNEQLLRQAKRDPRSHQGDPRGEFGSHVGESARGSMKCDNIAIAR